METFEAIQEVISTTLNVPTNQIHSDSRASDFSEWDSVHHLILVMNLEQKFGFSFSLAEIAALDSVGKIVKAVQKRVTT